MASFSGNIENFEKFIGPRLRNIVQTSISRKYKLEKGRCENCNSTKQLESAHIKGKDRKWLMKEAYKPYVSEGMLSNVNLNEFEERFVKLHYPLNETIRILCKACHRAYDNVTDVIEIVDVSTIVDEKSESADVLGIELNPNDTTEFKELLLLYKSAFITVYYNGGNVEVKEWNASNFKSTSDVFGNLRSRKEFRKGNWQELNISRIEVSINYDSI